MYLKLHIERQRQILRVWWPTSPAETASFQFIKRLCIKAITRSEVEGNIPCPVLACTCRGDTIILSCVCNTYTPHAHTKVKWTITGWQVQKKWVIQSRLYMIPKEGTITISPVKRITQIKNANKSNKWLMDIYKTRFGTKQKFGALTFGNIVWGHRTLTYRKALLILFIIQINNLPILPCFIGAPSRQLSGRWNTNSGNDSMIFFNFLSSFNLDRPYLNANETWVDFTLPTEK